MSRLGRPGQGRSELFFHARSETTFTGDRGARRLPVRTLEQQIYVALSRIEPAIDLEGACNFRAITRDILVHEYVAAQHHLTYRPSHAARSQPEAMDSKYTGAELLPPPALESLYADETASVPPWCVSSPKPPRSPTSPTADPDTDITEGTVTGVSVPAPPARPDPRTWHGGAASVVSVGNPCVGPPSPMLIEVHASNAVGQIP